MIDGQILQFGTYVILKIEGKVTLALNTWQQIFKQQRYILVENPNHLVKWTLFPMQRKQTRSAHRVSTTQTDGAPVCWIKVIATHGARQEFSPLRRLNRHPPKNYVIII